MTAETTRFEFRCWPDLTTALRHDVEARYDLAPAAWRTDIYFPAAHRDDLLIKLRSGSRFDIKACIGWQTPLEIWQMQVASDFPLTADEQAMLAGIFAGLSGASDPLADPADALRRLSAVSSARTVKKARRLSDSGGLRAELTEATCAGISHWTLAFECASDSQLMDEMAALSLGHFDNLSYGAALRHPALFGGAIA